MTLILFCFVACQRGKKPPAAKDVREVVAGDGHACALFKDGALRCWGSNTRGQAGRAAGEPVLQPIAIASTGPIADVYAGSTLTLVHLADKSWRGWGSLGDAENKTVPLDIVAAPWKKAAIGHSHVCGVSDAGTLSCAGDNAFGQLGTGVRDGSAKPANVVQGTHAVDVVSGARHSCALKDDGTVWCWGDNTKGQLGNGTNIASPIPVLVAGLPRAESIAAGDADTCAVLVDRTVSCWGENAHGELGDGTHDARSTPRSVSSLVSVDRMALGKTHSCALLTDGTVRCWGDNSEAELSDGTTVMRTEPVRVSGQYEVKELVAGSEFSCLRTIEVLRCWGSDKTAAIGDWRVSADPTTVPVDVRF